MIFVTGDTHGEHDYHKLTNYAFVEQKELTKNDYVIICGDFGGIWSGDERDKKILDFYEKRNFTTLFVDGNHENFNLIEKYPCQLWKGGKVHKIKDNLFHLMRGQIFNIENKKFFTFGGGTSIDKIYRVEGISWWPQEIPSKADVSEALEHLECYNFEVDYVLTHTAPTRICTILNQYKINDPVCKMLDKIEQKLKFKHWYFGHFHRDYPNVMGEKFTALYNEVLEVK